MGFFTPRPVGPEGVSSSSYCRTPTAASFGYYTNMVQQIEFIIHANIQPIRQLFLHKVKGQGQRLTRFFLTR